MEGETEGEDLVCNILRFKIQAPRVDQSCQTSSLSLAPLSRATLPDSVLKVRSTSVST